MKTEQNDWLHLDGDWRIPDTGTVNISGGKALGVVLFINKSTGEVKMFGDEIVKSLGIQHFINALNNGDI